jgi:eukaryotic-like serine/threonine-protein kinase
MPKRIAARISSAIQGSGESLLPADIALSAARRVGMAGITYSISFLAFDAVFSSVRGSEVSEYLLRFRIMTAVAVLSGVGLFLLSRLWKQRPRRVIQAGLIFQVVSSLLIALSETLIPFGPDEFLRGHSAVAIWIAAMGLLAPAPFREALVANLASALMAPLAIGLHMGIMGNRMPSAGQWILFCTAPLLMAVVTSALTRWIYQLGVDLRSAQELGSYQMIEKLGQGGMGEVWRARHRYLAREAAVKLISTKVSGGGEQQRRRFEREARVISQLECPNTVSLYDFGVSPSGQLYFAMELIRGLDLEKLVNQFGPQPAARVKHILMGTLDSLEEAHRLGLIHRDIKPSNVILARLGLRFDFVKVVDFGLARVVASEGEEQLSTEHMVVGTPAFMAPEMATGETQKQDGRSDLYSLACLADWLLTGQHVFSGSTPMAVLLRHASEPPPRLRERTELVVPDGLEELLLRCLSKEPEMRPASVAEFRKELETLEFGEWTQEDAVRWWKTNLPQIAVV